MYGQKADAILCPESGLDFASVFRTFFRVRFPYLNSRPLSVPEIKAAFGQDFYGLARADLPARAGGKRHALGAARRARAAALAVMGSMISVQITNTR